MPSQNINQQTLDKSMKILIITLFTAILPWNQYFRQEMALDENVVWAAMDISGLEMNYKEGTRAGLWGLTPAVARNYGLRVDRWIDERYDVKRSSIAAARYMKDLLTKYDNDTTRALLAFVNTPFRQLGDNRWVTPGRQPRNISEQKLQALIEEYNITDDERACRIAETDSIRAAATKNTQTATEQQQAQPLQQTTETHNTLHTVTKGETLSHIARKYGCTISQIKQWNGMKSDVIQVGQKLKIKK